MKKEKRVEKWISLGALSLVVALKSGARCKIEGGIDRIF